MSRRNRVHMESLQDRYDDYQFAMLSKFLQATFPNEHTMDMLQRRNYQCTICYEHFAYSSVLQFHMRTHTGEKPFQCEKCDRAFTTCKKLKKHLKAHERKDTVSSRDSSSPEQPPLDSPSLREVESYSAAQSSIWSQKRYHCEACERSFYTLWDLNLHIRALECMNQTAGESVVFDAAAAKCSPEGIPLASPSAHQASSEIENQTNNGYVMCQLPEPTLTELNDHPEASPTDDFSCGSQEEAPSPLWNEEDEEDGEFLKEFFVDHPLLDFASK